MTCLLEQGLEIEIGFVTLEEAPLLLSIEAEAPTLHVSERLQSLDGVADCTGRHGSRGGQIPGTATALWSRKFGCRTSTHSHGFKPSLVILVSWTVFSDYLWTQRKAAPTSLGAATADVPRPFVHQTTSITTVATRAATVKYRTTPTYIAISWDFQISVPLAVTFRARCQDTFR